MEFKEIFEGSQTYHGLLVRKTWNEEKKKWDKTCKTEPSTPINFEAHLLGQAKGLNPYNEVNHKVRWLALDIDEYNSTPERQSKLLKDIWQYDHKLMPFRSINNSIHIFGFYDDWTDLDTAKKDSLRIQNHFIKKGYNVDKTHTLPASKGWIFLPYHDKDSACLSPRGDTLSKEQFEFRYKYRKHRLISGLVGHKEGGRHKALFAAALYIRHKKINLTLEELNENLGSKIDNKDIKHLIKSAEKEEYDIDHLKRNFENYNYTLIGLDPPEHKPENKKENLIEDLEEEPNKLIGHDLKDYFKLDIKPTKFIVQRLLKEKSINFISGPKGNGKTEVVIGIGQALARGKNFLHYECPEATPVIYMDGEMDPYDIIERTDPYNKLYGFPPDDHFHILNYALQPNECFLDLKSEKGQEFILDYIEDIKTQTNKTPVIIFDNLRSLSNYKENDSDEFLPIGKFLLKLRGRGITSIVIDHHGKTGDSPRGTSSKTDWANISMIVKSETEKGNPKMRMRISFDKARGLRPDETDPFLAEYTNGIWNLGTSKFEQGEDALCEKIHSIRNEHKAYAAKERAKINMAFENGLYGHGKNARKKMIEKLNKVKDNLTQKELSNLCEVSVGKINGILKTDGTFDKWKLKQLAKKDDLSDQFESDQIQPHKQVN